MEGRDKMKIRSRLLLLVALSLLSLLAVGGLVLGQLQILNHSVSNITDSALPSIRASDDIQLSFERLNTLIYRGLNTVDEKEWGSIQAAIAQQRAALNKSVEVYGGLAKSAEDKRVYGALKNSLNDYLAKFDLTLRAAQAGDQGTAARLAGIELQQTVQQTPQQNQPGRCRQRVLAYGNRRDHHHPAGSSGADSGEPAPVPHHSRADSNPVPLGKRGGRAAGLHATGAGQGQRRAGGGDPCDQPSAGRAAA